MAYKIEVDRNSCIGCGACVATCNNFKLDDEGKSVPKQAEVEQLSCEKEAEAGCPVRAISIKEI